MISCVNPAYKPYHTRVELEKSGKNEHHEEFYQVTQFLFDDEKKHETFKDAFKKVQSSFSDSGATKDELKEVVRAAEKTMYQAVCRTERLLIEGSGAFIDDHSQTEKSLDITKQDIESFVAAENLSEKHSVPISYVKSCPYLLSFIQDYVWKKRIKEDNLKDKTLWKKFCGSLKKSKSTLFLDKEKLEKYEPLHKTNARLAHLINAVFGQVGKKKKSAEGAIEATGAEKLLWVPPTIPYYPPQGVFEKVKNFSKFLLFSQWEIVPRMVACMLSYEAERLTMGKIPSQKEKGYSENYPSNRLTGGREKILTTASQWLADLYNPIENMGKSLEEIKKGIRAKIEPEIQRIKVEHKVPKSGQSSTDWYWILPLLIDKEKVEIPKGKMPDDIVEVLCKMAIASPAICALRLFRKKDYAEKFASGEKVGRPIGGTFLEKNSAEDEKSGSVVGMFNTSASTAVVEFAYQGKSKKMGLDTHSKKVLQYCVDGNFAAMLDEYAHLLKADKTEDNPENLCDQMCKGLALNTASYDIDTLESFIADKQDKKSQTISMRSHYAVGYYQVKKGKETIQRKENLRNAFNSPFRPFVLATTSIGQEGLDFHQYARKIVHWNLPHNAIDIEQREGRINRYKCLAIRQSLAAHYHLAPKEDVWKELFDRALEDKQPDQPALIPYWCLPDKVLKSTKIKIERMVPMYPYSRDQGHYERLLEVLSYYRMTLGQPNQEELLKQLTERFQDAPETLKELFIDLSPFTNSKKSKTV